VPSEPSQVTGSCYLQKIFFNRRENSLIVKSVTLNRKKVQLYFRVIDFKNLYVENAKNKKIVNL
jgi:hypothetical protein